jgi:nitroimidazol reductase NimA-like FMN-containing flavoprotein (pyridoxamine 5'-phosphate oxidase superfamily)
MSNSVPVDHVGLEVLDFDECLRLLASQPIGRLAFIDAGEPVILPINHAVDGLDVVFRTTTGSKLDAALRGAVVAFEVDAWDELYRTGWSVLLRGRLEEVDADEVAGVLLRPYADRVARDRYVRIIADEVSGRRIV